MVLVVKCFVWEFPNHLFRSAPINILLCFAFVEDQLNLCFPWHLAGYLVLWSTINMSVYLQLNSLHVDTIFLPGDEQIFCGHVQITVWLQSLMKLIANTLFLFSEVPASASSHGYTNTLPASSVRDHCTHHLQATVWALSLGDHSSTLWSIF